MYTRHFLPAILMACMITPANAAKPTGEWAVADGSARVRVLPCKDALWGVIAWTKKPGTDKNNPDPTLRNRSVIGMPILLNMKQAEPNRWDGEVYNARDGKTYTANISLVSDDVLRVEGCVFGGLFCGSQDWTREAAQSDPAAKDSPPGKEALPKEICP